MRLIFLLACGVFGPGAVAQRPVLLPAYELALLPAFRPVPVERMSIPAGWSYQRLGVFCKLDVQLERRLRMPLLFRLGDVQRVEAMEGKGPLRTMDLR